MSTSTAADSGGTSRELHRDDPTWSLNAVPTATARPVVRLSDILNRQRWRVHVTGRPETYPPANHDVGKSIRPSGLSDVTGPYR